MFTLISSPLGSVERLIIQKQNGAELEILTGWGAGLNAWRIPTEKSTLNLLYGYQTEESFWKIQNDTSAGVRLAPWAGRTNNAIWNWKGETFKLDNNVSWAKHALHGLVHQKKWLLKSFTSDTEKAILTLAYDWTGNHDGFPFPFHAETIFTFTGHSFSVKTKTTNTGSKEMPYSEGFHPYFSLGEKIDNLTLKIPASEKVLVDSTDIPTGKRETETRFNDSLLGDTFINDCFAIQNLVEKSETILKSSSATLSVWQNSNAKEYRFIQIYTAPDRESIAIEPMTHEPDVLNHHRELITLQPGETLELEWGASVAIHQ
jgi:aldose 1-epimerase